MALREQTNRWDHIKNKRYISDISFCVLLSLKSESFLTKSFSHSLSAELGHRFGDKTWELRSAHVAILCLECFTKLEFDQFDLNVCRCSFQNDLLRKWNLLFWANLHVQIFMYYAWSVFFSKTSTCSKCCSRDLFCHWLAARRKRPAFPAFPTF